MVGSDPSAARGRYSEVSEWQRSKKSRKSVSPKIFSGTATGPLLPPVQKQVASFRTRKGAAIDSRIPQKEAPSAEGASSIQSVWLFS